MTSTIRKIFGGKKSGKEYKENSQPSKKTDDDIPDHGLSPEEVADLNLPIPRGKRDRNLSISRSGRHKLRNKQRSSIMKDEFYAKNGEQDPNSPTSPTSPTSPVAKSSKPDEDTKHVKAHAHSTTKPSSSHATKSSPHNSWSSRNKSKGTPPSNCRNVGVTNNRLQGTGSSLPTVSQTTAV